METLLLMGHGDDSGQVVSGEGGIPGGATSRSTISEAVSRAWFLIQFRCQAC